MKNTLRIKESSIRRIFHVIIHIQINKLVKKTTIGKYNAVCIKNKPNNNETITSCLLEDIDLKKNATKSGNNTVSLAVTKPFTCITEKSPHIEKTKLQKYHI